MNRPTSLGSTPLYAALLALPAFVLCAVLAFTAAIGLAHLGFLKPPMDADDGKLIGEIFSRLTLLQFLGLSYFALLAVPSLRRAITGERWRLNMAILFAVGSLCALADPSHPVGAEMNWIRYWTAGALALAGAAAIYRGATGGCPVPDRLFGVSFGIVLIAAGADEVFELHEHLGRLATHFGTTAVDSQDFITLGVGLAAALGIGLVVLAWKLGLSWLNFLADPRYRRPFRLLILAVAAYLFAMVLDSTDERVHAAVIRFLTADLGLAQFSDDRLWIAASDIWRLSNAAEELFEYLSALYLLITIGALYSLKTLGFAESR